MFIRYSCYSKYFFFLIILLLGLAIFSCQPQSPGAGGPGGTVINSNSLITGEIKAIRQQAEGYPWELDILILTATDVDSLPNPVKDKIGQVITARTDEKVGAFQPGQKVSANIKYTGDVPRPGIILYIYNIKIIK